MADKKKNAAGWDALSVRRTWRFGLERKVVSTITSEGWHDVPLGSMLFEPDVTDFMAEYKRLRKEVPGWENVSLNSVFLYMIAQALIACPIVNAHLKFKPRTITGIVKEYEDINITCPVIMSSGRMVTVNVHNLEKMRVGDIQAYMDDVRRRAENTNFTQALYDTVMADSMKRLKEGKIFTLIFRAIGMKFGAGPIDILKGQAKKDYYAIPEEDRLTPRDLEQGTFVFSNLGSVYHGGMYAVSTIADVIPPTIAAMNIAGTVKRMGVVTKPDGTEAGEPRLYLPINITMDHRPLDFGDIAPMGLALANMLHDPEDLKDWL